MGVWGNAVTTPTVQDDVPPATRETDPAQLVTYMALLAAEVGQLEYHRLAGDFDGDVPGPLADADRAAFEAATDAAAGYPVQAIAKSAYDGGLAHTGGQCSWCDNSLDFDDIARVVVSNSRSAVLALA